MPRRKPFRYGTLLRVRRRQEDLRAQALATARREHHGAERRCTELGREQGRVLACAGMRSSGRFRAGDVRRYFQYERYLARLVTETDALVHELRDRVEGRRQALEEAMKRRRILERLEARQQGAFKSALAKEEQAMIDEAATNHAAFARGRAEATIAADEEDVVESLALIGVAVLVFLLTLVAAVAVSGNLTKESLSGLVQGPPPKAVAEGAAQEATDPLARALSLRDWQARLDEREDLLDERATVLEQREAQLEDLQADIRGMQTQLQATLDAQETERSERMNQVAASLAEMKPENAAKVLEEWPEVDDAAELLYRVAKEKDRGKILDKLDPRTASDLLRAIEERQL